MIIRGKDVDKLQNGFYGIFCVQSCFIISKKEAIRLQGLVRDFGFFKTMSMFIATAISFVRLIVDERCEMLECCTSLVNLCQSNIAEPV